ncbi:MAG TPA: heavy metal translocating P-type ATPase, partial [Chromatiales bacterium]|nr:heavy metal translocating P-type ATPase [Chromatiales bacterium]
MASETRRCYHCGNPVPRSGAPVLQIQGRKEAFCCEGCRAVCAAILEAGQGDYYRFREQPGGSPGGATDPDLLKSLSLYDRPELQSSFVRRGSGWLEATLALEEVRCAACLWLNEQHLRGLDGVLDATVDFTTHRARVRWDPERIALSEILRAIAAIGYVARPLDPRRMQELAPVRKRRNVERILFAGIVGMPVMQVAFATYLMGEPGPSGALPMWVTIGRWSSLVATAAILVYSAQDFFIGAWRDLRHRRLGMDVPIVIGLAVAWWGSAYATWTARGEVYYDSIVMFVVLVLLARHLELRSRLDAVRALDRLARVVPRTARFLDERGTERWVPVTDLAPGDRIRVRPGETVP